MNQALLLFSSRIGFIISCFAGVSKHHAIHLLDHRPKEGQESSKKIEQNIPIFSNVCMKYILQMLFFLEILLKYDETSPVYY